jgi:hypothetical protein
MQCAPSLSCVDILPFSQPERLHLMKLSSNHLLKEDRQLSLEPISHATS